MELSDENFRIIWRSIALAVQTITVPDARRNPSRRYTPLHGYGFSLLFQGIDWLGRLGTPASNVMLQHRNAIDPVSKPLTRHSELHTKHPGSLL